jgi:hypothetical protein
MFARRDPVILINKCFIGISGIECLRCGIRNRKIALHPYIRIGRYRLLRGLKHGINRLGCRIIVNNNRLGRHLCSGVAGVADDQQ